MNKTGNDACERRTRSVEVDAREPQIPTWSRLSVLLEEEEEALRDQRACILVIASNFFTKSNFL